MSKIKVINRQICRELQSEIEQVMSKFATKHGLSLEMGRGSYAPAELHTKFILRTNAGKQNEINTNNSVLARHGLKIGDQVRFSGGKILTIVGYNPSAPKRPVELTLPGNPGKYCSSISSCTMGLVKNPA